MEAFALSVLLFQTLDCLAFPILSRCLVFHLSSLQLLFPLPKARSSGAGEVAQQLRALARDSLGFRDSLQWLSNKDIIPSLVLVLIISSLEARVLQTQRILWSLRTEHKPLQASPLMCVCPEGGCMDVSIPVSEAQVVAALCVCGHESPCGTVYFGVGVCFMRRWPHILPRLLSLPTQEWKESEQQSLTAYLRTDHWLVC